MSQDLFAAFGTSESGPSSTYTSFQDHASHNTAPILSEDALASSVHTLNDQLIEKKDKEPEDTDDDDFGDFEDGSASATQEIVSRQIKGQSSVQEQPIPTFPPKAVKPSIPPDRSIGRHPFAGNMDILFGADDDDYDAGPDDMGDLATNPEAAMAFSKRIIAEQENKAKRRQAPVSRQEPARPSTSFPQLPYKASKGANQSRAKDPTVLFDADNLSEPEDEDFGDFEENEESQTSQSTSKAGSTQTLPTLDLLGLDDAEAMTPVSIDSRGSRPNTLKKPTVRAAPRSHTTPANDPKFMVEDDTWDDFEEAEPSFHTSVISSTSTAPKMASDTSKQSMKNSDDSPPPTNVPPPVVLLSVFSSIFASAHETLFEPLGRLDAKSRQALLARQATYQFLRGHINEAIVLAHIIAGRKSRWKRDQYLAQGMRIGPAGGKSGMKLTGIDRSEVAKEDREVLEAVRLWKTQVGKVRGAIATASTVIAAGAAKLPHLPEIADHMPVRVVKASEGGITAPHACYLCGLRREERVAKVDVDVDDSFGEWWVQKTSMHLSCREFWKEHKDKLKSR